MSEKKSPETSDHQEIADRHQAAPVQGDAANNDHHYTLDPTAPDGNPPRRDNVKKCSKINKQATPLPLHRPAEFRAPQRRNYLDAQRLIRRYVDTYYTPENTTENLKEEELS